MNEEKESCKFQQNYNVFGLDDKPCCYLYHKYCDDINSCDYKQRIRLEQENKQIKYTLEEIRGLLSPHCTQCLQVLDIINEVLNDGRE